VTSSSNVIIEDLHSTRNLETTYYVTDVTQASDFYWDRESGLRVNIGIHGVQLIAEYRDVNHAGKDDNLFILDKPVDSDDKNTFREVVHGFCRLVLYCYLLSLLLKTFGISCIAFMCFFAFMFSLFSLLLYVFIDVRLSHLNKDHLLTYLLTYHLHTKTLNCAHKDDSAYLFTLVVKQSILSRKLIWLCSYGSVFHRIIP